MSDCSTWCYNCFLFPQWSPTPPPVLWHHYPMVSKHQPLRSAKMFLTQPCTTSVLKIWVSRVSHLVLQVQHALRRKAGLRSGGQRSGAQRTEYHKQFNWKKPATAASPLLTAEQVQYFQKLLVILLNTTGSLILTAEQEERCVHLFNNQKKWIHKRVTPQRYVGYTCSQYLVNNVPANKLCSSPTCPPGGGRRSCPSGVSLTCNQLDVCRPSCSTPAAGLSLPLRWTLFPWQQSINATSGVRPRPPDLTFGSTWNIRESLCSTYSR